MTPNQVFIDLWMLQLSKQLKYSVELSFQKDIKVADEVKDMWAPPHTEPGIPPLLTMPGVQSPNDLVNNHKLFLLI